MGSYVELLKACKEGNAKKVKKLLGTCKNISDVRDLTDKTLLHYCFQNEACTDLLLEIAPELLNVGEKSGYTVLHLASMMKPPTPLQYLLSKNPDINKKTNELRTPLLLAVIYDNYDAVKILCNADAEVNVTDCLGVSPLHYAAKSKSEKDVDEQLNIIDILLENRAKIEFLDSFERTPLIWAVSSNNLEKMRYLISKGANVNAKDISGLSILHYATSNGNLEIIKSILSEYNFPIDTADNNHCTALMYACTMNQSAVVKTLLHHGANVNAEDLKRRSAVHFACGKGDIEIVRMLAEHNADLWKTNEDLTFPLHEASFKGHMEIVQFFVTHSSAIDRLSDLINRKNANGQTSLHLAAVKDHLEICRILLKNGADPNIHLRASNGKSMTALDLSNRSTTKELIIEYDGKTTDELTNMCPITEENSYSISEVVVGDGESSFSFESGESSECGECSERSAREEIEKNAEEADKNGIELTESLKKSLLESCYRGNVDEVRALASRGVSMCAVEDSTGRNLLHYSVKNLATFEVILELAPECVNRCDNARLSVLNASVMSKENKNVALLLARGADFNFVDGDGRTCLHLAVLYNNVSALILVRESAGQGPGPAADHRADREGNFPLHYAVEMYKGRGAGAECRAFIEALLALGADLECRDRAARSPLLLAVNVSNCEAVAVLLSRGADVVARDAHCLCSVHYACSEGSVDILELLAQDPRFDPDVEDQNGLTPIFYAVANCNDRVLQRLVALRARTDGRDKYGRTLCHKAAEKGAFKCLELLLELRADPWVRSHDGTMPLHEAAYRGYKEVAEILLRTEQARANVNVKNVSGQTPLHLAAARNDCPMCFLLIREGCSVNELLYDANSDSDNTAYDLATTPYCQETLYAFGGRSAKRIKDQVIVDDQIVFQDRREDQDGIQCIEDLLKDASFLESAYSVRSTELALSTLPSVLACTDRTSQLKVHSTKQSSQRSVKKESCNCSLKSLIVNGKTANSPHPDKEDQINVPSLRSSKTDKSPKSELLERPDASSQSSLMTRKSSPKIVSAKSSKRSKTSLSSSSINQRDKAAVISHQIQDKVHSSIFNYEFIRLDSRIACDLARQKIRKENIEKLINPKTPKMLRRTKAVT